MEGQSPKHHHALPRDAKRARCNSKHVRHFSRAQHLIAGQAVQRQDRQWREERTEEDAFDDHRPKDLIVRLWVIEESDPVKRGCKSGCIEAG